MGHHLPTNSLLPWERRPITIREDGDAGNGKGIDEKDGVWRKKYVDGWSRGKLAILGGKP